MKNLEIVKKILIKYVDTEKNKIYLFGSRTTPEFRADSDLDILIDDVNVKPEILSFLNEEFESSNLPYKVDVVLRSRIEEVFYQKIKKDLQPLV